MVQNTDLTFFTNEPERDLYSRFSKILKSNTQFFDVLVGYFRTSGFFKMYDAMETVEKIRILVGLNVDKYTVKIIDKEELGTLSESAKGWKKELNLVSWNGAAPKYDLRDWSPEHEKMGKGITLSADEVQKLYEILKNIVED